MTRSRRIAWAFLRGFIHGRKYGEATIRQTGYFYPEYDMELVDVFRNGSLDGAIGDYYRIDVGGHRRRTKYGSGSPSLFRS